MASKEGIQLWINQTKGKYVDFDGAYGEQCFDLAMKYMKDVFGITTGFPKAGGRAKDIPNAMKGWTGWTIGHWSKATDLQVGDIITWNARPGAADTTWGHVAIYAGNNQKFETNGTGNAGASLGDNATLRTLVTGGAYMYARPKLIGGGGTTSTASKPNDVFRANGNKFTLQKPIKVDAVKFHNGIWQFLNYDLAGIKKPTNQDWTENGIPLAIVDRTDGGNNSKITAGAVVKMKRAYSYGTIDWYNDKDQYCAIDFKGYGRIYFNSDALLNRF